MLQALPKASADSGLATHGDGRGVGMVGDGRGYGSSDDDWQQSKVADC